MPKENSKAERKEKLQHKTKAQLVAEVANALNMTQKDVANTLNATIDAIVKSLKEGMGVTLTGFLTMLPDIRKERMGRHPQTREPIKIPAKSYVRMTAGSELKKAVEEVEAS